MGVHGLATYLRENLRALSTSLILSQEQAKSKPTLPLVVDGWSFIYEVHNQSRLPWVYGGELEEFRDLVIRVVRAWIAVGLRPYFVFDGPYRPSKFTTSATRMAQSIIQPSLLFFRTSSLSRATPRFLRENSILPPLYYATTLDALRSLNDAVKIYFADDEGDPFAVELAGRLKGYVTGRDSDYVILNSEGYAGYIPMDQMFWSIESHETEGGSQSEDDAGFVVARKYKVRGHANEASNSLQGIIPPDINGELSLSCLVYTPHALASHFQISISLLPLLNYFPARKKTELLQGIMDCDNLSSSCQLEEKGGERISITDEINRLQHSSSKSDSFIMDMERFSHLTSKDITANSRITLQRNFSRKGSKRGSEKKMNSSIENERDPNSITPTSSSSPRGTSTPEKPTLVAVGPTINPQLHHQITISTGKVGTGTGTTTPTAENKFATKRFISFKRSSPCRTIDPRRILFIFATLSSMGTILLIFFTLSMAKFSGDENALNS